MQADTYMSELRDRGYRLTGKRKMILEFLLTHNRYISARELIDHMKSNYPTLSFETVYRNLKTLRDEGMIEESSFGDNETKYRIACQDEHHHHYICIECGQTMTIEHCPMPALGHEPEGFHILRHRFEVLGICAQCQAQARAQVKPTLE
ncbi:MAG: Fur family transcriptional regulator [Firmicutes bacterium]|nr:Fur family transcriptional regulator [Bacillota bacterium]